MGDEYRKACERRARFFERIPVANTIEEALDLMNGGPPPVLQPPVLHTRPGGDVVGLVEVTDRERRR